MTMEETLTLIEKTAFLRSIPLLASIPTEPLAELAGRAREIHSDAGEVLFQEGDPDRGTYVVIDGLLQLRRGRSVVRVLKSGMAFGELWLAASPLLVLEMSKRPDRVTGASSVTVGGVR